MYPLVVNKANSIHNKSHPLSLANEVNYVVQVDPITAGDINHAIHEAFGTPSTISPHSTQGITSSSHQMINSNPQIHTSSVESVVPCSISSKSKKKATITHLKTASPPLPTDLFPTTHLNTCFTTSLTQLLLGNVMVKVKAGISLGIMKMILKRQRCIKRSITIHWLSPLKNIP